MAPAGARQLVSSVRPTPNDAQLPTKPAGPKSELPTANRPVATSLFAVQFQQNHINPLEVKVCRSRTKKMLVKTDHGGLDDRGP